MVWLYLLAFRVYMHGVTADLDVSNIVLSCCMVQVRTR